MLNEIERLKDRGIRVTGYREGLPMLEGYFLQRDSEGKLRAYVDRKYETWEEPTEAKSVSRDTLDLIETELSVDSKKTPGEWWRSLSEDVQDEITGTLIQQRLKDNPAYMAEVKALLEKEGFWPL
jgi:hypothetical protein